MGKQVTKLTSAWKRLGTDYETILRVHVGIHNIRVWMLWSSKILKDILKEDLAELEIAGYRQKEKRLRGF